MSTRRKKSQYLLSVLIVENDSIIETSFATLTNQEWGNFKTLAVMSGEALNENITRLPIFDLVVIDLDVPNAFEMAEKLKSQQFTPAINLAFLTSVKDYDIALRALALSAVALIAKPVSTDDVIMLFERTLKRLNQSLTTDTLENLNNLESTTVNPKSFFVPTSKQTKESIEMGEILFIKAQDNLSLFYLQSGQTITAFRILGFYKKMFLEHPDFVQIHHGLIINVRQVKSYNGKNREILMSDNTILLASRRFSKNLKNI